MGRHRGNASARQRGSTRRNRARPVVAVNDPMRRPREVQQMIGVSESTLYRMTRRGEFPPPVMITASAIGWPESTVKGWIEQRRSAAR